MNWVEPTGSSDVFPVSRGGTDSSFFEIQRTTAVIKARSKSCNCVSVEKTETCVLKTQLIKMLCVDRPVLACSLLRGGNLPVQPLGYKQMILKTGRQPLHDYVFFCFFTFTGKTRTKEKYRVVYTDHQRLELEKEFHFNRYITIRRKSELAVNLGLSERQVGLY